MCIRRPDRGDDFRIYRVERDEETIRAILEKEVASGTGLKPEPSRSNQRQRHISDVRKGLRNKYRG